MTSPDTKPAMAEASAVALREKRAMAIFGIITNANPDAFHPAYEHDQELWLQASDALAALQFSSSAEAGDPGSMRAAPSHGNAEGLEAPNGFVSPASGPSDELALRAALRREIDAQITICAERDSYRDAMLIAIEQRDRAELRATAAEAERDALRAENEKLREDGKKLIGMLADCALDLGEAKARIRDLERAALNHGKGEDIRAAVTKDQGGEHGE